MLFFPSAKGKAFVGADALCKKHELLEPMVATKAKHKDIDAECLADFLIFWWLATPEQDATVKSARDILKIRTGGAEEEKQPAAGGSSSSSSAAPPAKKAKASAAAGKADMAMAAVMAVF